MPFAVGTVAFQGLNLLVEGLPVFCLVYCRYTDQRQLRHRQKEREKILALPAPARVSRDRHDVASRDVTPENRTDKKREEKTTTEQIRLLLSDTPLSEISDNELKTLIKRHGFERVTQVADISAETSRRERKEIRNPGG
jgi:hypothetical protein